MKPKYCMNCLKPTDKCDCVFKVVDISLECPDCNSVVSEEDNFCRICGNKLSASIPMQRKERI